MNLPQTGGCQCGKVRYEITRQPEPKGVPNVPVSIACRKTPVGETSTVMAWAIDRLGRSL